MQRLTILFALLLVMLLSACGRRLDTTPIPTVDESANADEETLTLASLLDDASLIGDPANEQVAAVLEANPELGQTLFNVNNTNATCASCHLVNSDQRLVGPGLLGLLQRAGTRVAGESAVEYTYNAIVNPNVHIVEGYPQGVMPQTYGEQYSEAQLNHLVAYLMTLDDDGALLERIAEAATTPEATAGEAAAQVPTQTPYIIVVTATTQPATATPQPPTVTSQPPTATPTPVVVAVQPTEGPSPTPDRAARIANVSLASNGEQLFEASCAGCHTVDTAEMSDDGPGLLGIPQKAAQAPGQSAAAYLYNSILSPDIHSEDYAAEFSQAQLYDIVAYLLTLDAEANMREGETVEARDVAVTPTMVGIKPEETADVAAVEPIVEAVQAASADNGAQLWEMIEGGAPCSSCHYDDSTERLVGPGMSGIAERAADRTSNPVEVYLYNSIVNPNDYIVETYPAAVMPANYGELLTDEQIYDLVAYLMTLDE